MADSKTINELPRVEDCRADLTCASHGSLTLYIQAEKPIGVPEGNWLPAPAGFFSVALRTYLPKDAILDGAWETTVTSELKTRSRRLMRR